LKTKGSEKMDKYYVFWRMAKEAKSEAGRVITLYPQADLEEIIGEEDLLERVKELRNDKNVEALKVIRLKTGSVLVIR
jgi:hypothetical protein